VCLSSSVRRMFWCNTGHQPGVETSHLDGSHRRTLAIDKVYRPQSLAVDLPTKRLYVYDTRLKSFQFCTYDGFHCHQVLADIQVFVRFFSSFLRRFQTFCRFSVWSDEDTRRKWWHAMQRTWHLASGKMSVSICASWFVRSVRVVRKWVDEAGGYDWLWCDVGWGLGKGSYPPEKMIFFRNGVFWCILNRRGWRLLGVGYK